MNAFLMKEGAQDFRSGRKFDHTVFFGENVDVHHIFPRDWCKVRGIKPSAFDSIINTTPLAYRTNRIIGGIAPSHYIAKMEEGNETVPPIASRKLDAYRESHLIDPALLRADRFEACMDDILCSHENPKIGYRVAPDITCLSSGKGVRDLVRTEYRQKRLLVLIEQAMGKAAYIGDIAEEGEDAEADEDTAEAELTIAAA